MTKAFVFAGNDTVGNMVADRLCGAGWQRVGDAGVGRLRVDEPLEEIAFDLGQRLRMDRATTMTIINRLQARHFLRREKSPTDGRKQALYLTPQGEAMLTRLADEWRRIGASLDRIL